MNLIKNGSILLSVLVVCVVSCKKHDPGSEGGVCVSHVQPLASETDLRPSQIDSIDALFAQNNLSTKGLQFKYFTADEYLNHDSPTVASVMAVLFLNGLPVVGNDEAFVFRNGVLANSYLVKAVPTSNDTAGHLSFSFLRDAFLKHVSESKIYGGPASTQQPKAPSPADYVNSCLQAKLVYVDKVVVPGNQGQVQGDKYLVKVWNVSAVGKSYPSVDVEDDNGTAWGVSLFIP